MTFVNLNDAESLARERLPGPIYDYFAGGAADEITLADNRRVYDEVSLRPRILVDVSRRSMATTLLGRALPTPFVVAPMALHRMAHPDAELATTRAASAVGALMTISTLASVGIEEIVREAAHPPWFQLYVHGDRGITRALVERAGAAGCGALVLTVDTPVLGRRERDIRNAFQPPAHAKPANVPDGGTLHPGQARGSAMATYFAAWHDASVTWKDLAWLRSLSAMPLLLKGVVRGDDAKRAVDAGVDGIVVSNHGGRQLDTAIASARALPEVVEGAGGAIDVLVDGGIRRGTDVLKALAWGARAVMIGRPVLWGLACDGEAGATRVLTMIRDELDLAMALCGAPTVSSITPDLLAG